ncbi:MAG: hypothetical protein HQ539_03930 [Parcubacteria group bacterium]|nr:hypothetical protein [Parcubacteria group bacterium]
MYNIQPKGGVDMKCPECNIGDLRVMNGIMGDPVICDNPECLVLSNEFDAEGNPVNFSSAKHVFVSMNEEIPGSGDKGIKHLKDLKVYQPPAPV